MAPSIPTETFPSIFVYLSLFDLVRVSLVSRYWRSICLDTPSLWTGIETAGCKKSFLDAIAVRSGTLPLTIESNTNDLFCGSPLSMADALESVSEEHVMLVYLPRLMPRVKTLLLYDFNHTMGYILRHPAPVLEVLILSAGDGHLCDRAFRGQSGTSAPSFPALKKLALSSIAFFGGFELCQLLAVCPRLEELVFEFPDDVELPPGARFLPGPITTYAPRVRKVVLVGEPGETGPNIALLNSVREVYIDIPYDVDVSNPQESLGLVCVLFGRRPSNSPVLSLEVTNDGAIEIKTKSGFERTLCTQNRPCSPNAYACLLTRLGIFNTLVQMRLDISICGPALINGGNPPPAPNLEKLFLENCAPLIRLGVSCPRWDCPNLWAMVLVGGGCDCEGCATHLCPGRTLTEKIQLSALRGFLNSFFGFSETQVLALLSLRGIELEGIARNASAAHGLPVLVFEP